MACPIDDGKCCNEQVSDTTCAFQNKFNLIETMISGMASSFHPITEVEQLWSRCTEMGDHPVEGCNTWKIKCVQNLKQEYQRHQNGCVLTPF